MLALRPALNAPVLNVGFLPVGPARAAIVVFAEEWGGIGVAIGIRSNEGGQVAVLRNQESIEPDVTISAVLEPALAEAERMGFLFDEDLVENADSGQGQPQAMKLWDRLMGEIEMPSESGADSAGLTDDESVKDLPAPSALERSDGRDEVGEIPEFILEDVAEAGIPEISLECELEAEVPVAVSEDRPPGRAAPSKLGPPDASAESEPLVLSEPCAEEGTARANRGPQQPQLSKFRHIDDESGESSGVATEAQGDGETCSQLGRIPLVRVRRGREGTTRVPYLARLLSSF